MKRPCILALLAAVAFTIPGCESDDERPADPAPVQDEGALTTESHVHTNRLAKESSPYLLQHQHNPVDWYPWGEEAFARAKAEDKPIFLSIGYSTCHWCHVMERESFENEEVAAVMNEHFVCIKVDKEERPDVDAIYMTACQMMTGSGGWPLSAFLTVDRKPFFVGTYFPPEDRPGRIGFKNLLLRINDLWNTERESLFANADKVVDALSSSSAAQDGGTLNEATILQAVEQFKNGYDARHGGFGGPPKFPSAFNYSFLLQQSQRGRAPEMLDMVESTLEHIRLGGIHDHLGGGFHRYSTDTEWLVPHFEKMLYDQAYLARAYIDAWLITGKEHHADVARGIYDYVLRDLRDEAGGFHSAEDADSEGVEGKFYVWTRAEIVEVLGKEDGELFADVYRCTDEGNFVDESTRRKTGENIAHLDKPLQEHAEQRGVEPAKFAERMASLREKLLAVRSKRIRPHLDDKVLTDWNGMMISSFAYGGAALGEERYLTAAREAADFLLGTMRKPSVLLHRYRKGDAGIDGFLDDYAFLAQGLLDLYQATFDERYLREALGLGREMVRRFHDAEEGGFHFTAVDSLVARPKDLFDGATPSGNSAAALMLVRLGRITMDEDLAKAGQRNLDDWSATLARMPRGSTVSLTALDFQIGPTHEIVISGDPADEATKALIATLRSRYLPSTVVILHPPGEPGAAIRELSEFVAPQGLVNGKPAAYVCTAYACKAPVTSPAELAKLLSQ